MITKRTLLSAVVGALALSVAVPAVAEEAFPEKPIRLIVPYSPGGGTDTTARIVADSMSKYVGQPVVVENRPGASGTVGTLLATQAETDGYTILFGIQATLALNPSLFESATYDAKEDFTGIALISESPYVITVPGNSEIDGYQSFAARATENMTMANGGSAALLAARLLARHGNLQFTNIPYSGSGDAISDILAGRVNAMISSPVSVLPHIESGALKPILVTGTERYAALSDTPTADELGYDGFNVVGWYSVVAPVGVPQDRLDILSEAFNNTVTDPNVQEKLLGIGVTPSTRGLDSAGTTAFIASEVDLWSKEIEDAGITPK
ncbi:tripartite tricarboxylate transporter substrate binding protein [uncultured Aliiroseovarius sp.]|uniref:Bug family tripartite tricarboxylate transporter substrate binding protein n=1 Tax=uncultured Aliiroseovarius sp. TaxID=1658783 RepID=UPI00259491D5|nr:tripartite tricarboxylate transporter substrate binding protein [uncultured Aliiroseovarius sp.]